MWSKQAYNDIDDNVRRKTFQNQTNKRSRNNSQLDARESYPINIGSSYTKTKNLEVKLRPRTAVFNRKNEMQVNSTATPDKSFAK